MPNHRVSTNTYHALMTNGKRKETLGVSSLPHSTPSKDTHDAVDVNGVSSCSPSNYHRGPSHRGTAISRVLARTAWTAIGAW
jgi:hypothetical protein